MYIPEIIQLERSHLGDEATQMHECTIWIGRIMTPATLAHAALCKGCMLMFYANLARCAHTHMYIICIYVIHIYIYMLVAILAPGI